MSIQVSEWASGGRLAACALVVALGLSGCSPSIEAGESQGSAVSESSGDQTDWLSAGVLTIDAQVEGVSSDGQSGLIFDVLVDDVLASIDTYYFGGGEYVTPDVSGGDRITVHEGAPALDAQLEDGRFFFVLQVDGTPEDVAAGRDAHGFETPYFVLAVFDSTWQLVDAQRPLYPQLVEILALYPESLEGVGQLIADARAQFEAMLVYAGSSSAGGAAEVTTPGPLGEWRRAHGYEHEAIQDATAEVVAATPPELRQLPTQVEDFWPDIEESLGVGRLVEWHMEVEVGSSFAGTYHWIGIRFPGVGVIGPFSTETGPVVPVSGFGPPAGPVEIVGWTQPDMLVDLSKAEVLLRLSASEWQPADYLWFDASEKVEAYKVETLTEQAAVARSVDLAGDR